jgi:hypothetical protein
VVTLSSVRSLSTVRSVGTVRALGTMRSAGAVPARRGWRLVVAALAVIGGVVLGVAIADVGAAILRSALLSLGVAVIGARAYRSASQARFARRPTTAEPTTAGKLPAP